MYRTDQAVRVTDCRGVDTPHLCPAALKNMLSQWGNDKVKFMVSPFEHKVGTGTNEINLDVRSV